MSRIMKTAATLLLALALLAPSASYAQTITTTGGYQAQINALLALVAQLQAQLDALLNQGDIDVQAMSTSAYSNSETPASSSYGNFTIKYDVTALDGDLYIPTTASQSGSTVGATYSINDGAGVSGKVSQVLTSTADQKGKYFVVEAEETEVFTLTVTIDPSQDTSVFVRLETVQYALSAGGQVKAFKVEWNDDFKTNAVTIVNGSAPTTPTQPSVPTTGTPDLTVRNASASASGGTISASATIANTGSGATPGSFRSVWRVCDSNCTNYDRNGNDLMSALSAGASAVTSFAHTVTAAPGLYYYMICADVPYYQVSESYEDNNCTNWQAITVN